MRQQYYFYVAVVFILIPVFASRPMTSLFARQLEASMVEIGLITACFSFVPLLVAVFAGRYIDRYGERFPLLIGSTGIALSLCLPYFFPKIQILYLSQLLLGFSHLLALLAIQNGVAKSSSNQNLSRSIGSFSLFSSIGVLMGPLIGGYVTEHFGFKNSYLLLSLVPLASAIISIYISNSSSPKEQLESEKIGRMKELFLIPGLSKTIFASMIILSALDIFYAYFPLYGQSLGLSLSQIGWILAIQAFSNALVRVFMPRLVQLYGEVKILWVFMMVGAVAYGVIPFLNNFSIIIITAFILGAGLGVTQPLTIILTYTYSPPEKTGEVLGIRLASNKLAQTIIPFSLASLSNLVGLGSIFIIKSLMLFTGVLAARGITNKKDKNENAS